MMVLIIFFQLREDKLHSLKKLHISHYRLTRYDNGKWHWTYLKY